MIGTVIATPVSQTAGQDPVGPAGEAKGSTSVATQSTAPPTTGTTMLSSAFVSSDSASAAAVVATRQPITRNDSDSGTPAAPASPTVPPNRNASPIRPDASLPPSVSNPPEATEPPTVHVPARWTQRMTQADAAVPNRTNATTPDHVFLGFQGNRGPRSARPDSVAIPIPHREQRPDPRRQFQARPKDDEGQKQDRGIKYDPT